MADDEDIKAVMAGDKDLARRDLRDYDFSGVDFSEADLTGAHIERTNFTNANLAGATLNKANTLGMKMEGATLTSVKADSSVFVNVSFKNSRFSGSIFDRSHFSRAIFSGADLRNASFRNVHFNDGTDFEGALVDETTIFDGAHIIRPIARQEAFRFYEVVRGVLVRRKDDAPQDGVQLNANKAPNKPVPTGREHPLRQIDELLNALAPLEPAEIDLPPIGGMGHNNPPEITPIEKTEFQELTSVLGDIKIELLHDEMRPEVINNGVETAERIVITHPLAMR